MSTTPALDPALVRVLADGFGGSVLLPADDDYETARRVHNGLIDGGPALIARCAAPPTSPPPSASRGPTELEISVRGGGHNVAGRAVAEGGMMIDLSQMRGVEVDAEARTARAQGGALWRTSTRRPARTGWPPPAAPSPRPASPATRSAAASAG